ncbi:MAG TPA: ABC transporter substrate-binding protein [Paucimonas sp.]|nr:ABC transporter substrate-binding protein [Paucimonas sp.]
MWNKIKRSLIGVLLLASTAYAATPADPAKVLHAVFEADGDGFDPVRSINYYSGFIIETVFEPLLGYDYLARPVKLVPKTAEALPEVSDGGKTYVFRLKKGIYFSPDPVFKGKRRELTAADYVYSFKRVLDPRNRSQIASFLEGKIVGLDALAAQAKKTGRFDYDAPVVGLQAVDRYTLKIQLTKPDYNFQYVVAYGGLGAVAREVVEAHDGEIRPHPVGTGPYMLQQYVPHSKIVLVANPEYRGFTWDFQAAEPGDEKLVNEMRGKKMPQIGRVEISIIEEEQARWLAFQDKQLDIDFLPQLAAPKVMDGSRLKPEFEQQGIRLSRLVQAGVVFTLLNFNDPVLGGFTKEKIALRRAIIMSYDTDEEISLIRNGQAIKAQMIFPPSVAGHDPNYRSLNQYNPELANKLLDKFGYKRGADGYRTMPDGKPLTVKIHREPARVYQERAELWKRGLDRIGIRSDHPVSNFADNQKAAIECRLMMWGSGWNADFPDGENFLQLLYGPNSGQGNQSCYRSPAFDAMYDQAMQLPPGPERNRLYARMNRQMEVDGAWSVNVWRIRNYVAQPWVKGFKKHPILHAEWQYLDLEKR